MRMSRTPAKEGSLRGRHVAISGRLSSMTREEALTFLEMVGATFDRSPQKTTHYLVVGEVGASLADDGSPPASLLAAEEHNADGGHIEIISETEFLAFLGLDEFLKLYTAQQLSRILKVDKSEINSWVRRGLIRPVKIVNRLFYFDFSQVAGAKRLLELIRAGVSPGKIRGSLKALESWLPGAGGSLSQLAVLEQDGRLLVRLEDGALADPSGQLHLDFSGVEHSKRPRPIIASFERVTPSPDCEEESWFDIAVRLEEVGQDEEAAAAYQKALAVDGPAAETAFNLGNVLYRLGRREEAVTRFLQAVEIEPGYIESWNNLANAQFELGRPEDAIRSLRKALAADPNYADAHYNLAEILHQQRREEEACRHWEAYLKQDPNSTWADQVRERLKAAKQSRRHG